MEESGAGSRSVQIITYGTYPDPGGPKTYGYRSETLVKETAQLSIFRWKTFR